MTSRSDRTPPTGRSGPGASLVPDEHRRLIATMNLRREPPPETAFPELLGEAPAGNPVALVASGRVWRWADLAAAADRLAGLMRDRGVTRGDRVALTVEFGAEQIIAALAAVRCGAAYLPLPPELPRAALWQRCAHAGVGVGVVLTQSWLAERLEWPDGVDVVAVDEQDGSTTRGAPRPPGAGPAVDGAVVHLPGRGARVGSPIGGRELVASAVAVNRVIGLGASDRVLATAPVDSNRSCWEIFGPLLAGAALVLPRDIDLHEPSHLIDVLERYEVTVLSTTPTMAGRLVAALGAAGGRLPARLRQVLLAGERTDPALVGALRVRGVPELGVAVLAAPRRDRPWATVLLVGDVDAEWRSVPIGAPLPHHELSVLAESLQPCPVWVTGRLHFGGFAAGDEPDDDAVRDLETGRWLLRGDQFGRILPDGVVETVGELGARVTVRGRALNLWDTEIALCAHSAVREAVATPVGESSVLRARVSLHADRAGSAVDGEQLLAHLRRKVSPYLVPDRVDIVDELPLTTDGLLDRLAVAAESLPVTAPARATGGGSAAMMDQVARITCRVLDIGAVEPHMNLMDVGATSLELVRLATVVEAELGIIVDVRELLYFPSVAVIAGHAAAASSPDPPAPERAAAATPLGVLTGIAARQAFVDARNGVRHRDAEGIELAGGAVPTHRRTVRRFAPVPVEAATLAGLLEVLREAEIDGEPKYRYPSAGGAYPVRTYVLVEPERVRDVPAGSYYYHPVEHRLLSLGPGSRLEAAAHAEPNRAAFGESAFSLYLLTHLDSILPLYGQLSWDFSVFEAGAMTQLLCDAAEGLGLGMCPVGSMDPAPLRRLFALDDSERFVHCLLGGVPAGRP